MRPIYITHTSAISPQHHNAGRILQPLVTDEHGKFSLQEPDYTTVIPPMQLRRMSRLLKMGVFCGMDCILKSGLERPDGMVTGTAKGSMSDTEKFVKELKQYKEEALNPTPFILSTYNAINGAIALQTKATGYNQTYVHRGSSFEVSLYDTQLKLNGVSEQQHYLVGCFDEITAEYFSIKDKVNYWKKDRNTTIPLLAQHNSQGSIAGEGAAFFLLSNHSQQSIAAINHIDILYKANEERVITTITAALEQTAWLPGDIDMLLLGLNGDSDDQGIYESVIGYFGKEIPVMTFKNLCGEYETSGGFAFWLTCQYLSGEVLPQEVWYDGTPPTKQVKKILYYNHYRGLNHNIVLLSV